MSCKSRVITGQKLWSIRPQTMDQLRCFHRIDAPTESVWEEQSFFLMRSDQIKFLSSCDWIRCVQRACSHVVWGGRCLNNCVVRGAMSMLWLTSLSCFSWRLGSFNKSEYICSANHRWLIVCLWNIAKNVLSFMATLGWLFVSSNDFSVSLMCQNYLENWLSQKLGHIAMHFLFYKDWTGEATLCIIIALWENCMNVDIFMLLQVIVSLSLL